MEDLLNKALERFKDNEAMRKVLEAAKANQEKLDRCKRPHDFVITQRVIPKATCRKCGGIVDPIRAHFYLEGIVDARKQENENED